MANNRRLSSHNGLRVTYRDETTFGSAVSGQCEAQLQARFAVFYAYREKYGLGRLVRESREVLRRALPRCLDGISDGPERLNNDWLYPEPSRVAPVQLRVESDASDVIARIALPSSLVADLAAYLGDWQQGAKPPRSKAARVLWDALVATGALVTTTPPLAPERRPGITYIGHATLGIDDGDHRLLIDPYLLPRSTSYPRDWQPPHPSNLARPDAVFLTHSHPDHYDPGTLLRLGADTPIYVPAVQRESVLAIDMATRLRELGFQSVHRVEDWNEIQVGAMRVHALPFYGEQPTVAERLHPEIRNRGATYLVEAAGHRIAALADTGRDQAGDVSALAARMRRQHGPADTVFGCYRGFALYPVQYVFSSVSRYLPFVPADSWGERQQIMCDADDLLDVAERWSAKRVVPYAAGGAPWYWRRGLGPCLDGSMTDAISTDPPPEQVAEAAARRGMTRADGPIASPVEVMPMRVGESIKQSQTCPCKAYSKYLS